MASQTDIFALLRTRTLAEDNARFVSLEVNTGTSRRTLVRFFPGADQEYTEDGLRFLEQFGSAKNTTPSKVVHEPSADPQEKVPGDWYHTGSRASKEGESPGYFQTLVEVRTVSVLADLSKLPYVILRGSEIAQAHAANGAYMRATNVQTDQVVRYRFYDLNPACETIVAALTPAQLLSQLAPSAYGVAGTSLERDPETGTLIFTVSFLTTDANTAVGIYFTSVNRFQRVREISAAQQSDDDPLNPGVGGVDAVGGAVSDGYTFRSRVSRGGKGWDKGVSIVEALTDASPQITVFKSPTQIRARTIKWGQTQPATAFAISGAYGSCGFNPDEIPGMWNGHVDETTYYMTTVQDYSPYSGSYVYTNFRGNRYSGAEEKQTVTVNYAIDYHSTESAAYAAIDGGYQGSKVVRVGHLVWRATKLTVIFGAWSALTLPHTGGS